MLKMLQAELPKLWTDEEYSKAFRASPSKYKDFDHALKHVLKAAVALQNMVEVADHIEVPAFAFPEKKVKKYLADLVICAVRLALKSPGMKFDLEKEIIGRIEKKMKVRFNPVSQTFFPRKSKWRRG